MLRNFAQVLFWAGYHQKWVPCILPYKFWPIFSGMKQKYTFFRKVNWIGINFGDYPSFQPKQHLRKDVQHSELKVVFPYLIVL